MARLETGAYETAFTLPAAQSPGETFLVDISHELGSSLEDRIEERNITVTPSVWPTTVVFKSSVVASGARALKSAEYLAANRRRQCAKIADLIGALQTHAQSEDFAVWTHEPLGRIRSLIQGLSEAEEFSDPEHEGNACEILRQLRDTFLDGGWERYRDAEARDCAVEILQQLAAADEVSGEDASRTMDMLLDLGLNPAVGTLLQYGQEEASD
jgi:hypothetical protein